MYRVSFLDQDYWAKRGERGEGERERERETDRQIDRQTDTQSLPDNR